MTVCTAALFRWTFNDGSFGRAVVTASDRMITAGEFEYEPPQQKICFLTRRALVLVAGDYAVHSEALMRTQRQLVASPKDDIGEIAELYGSHVRAHRLRRAAQLYLSPLGLDEDSFIRRQKEMAPALAGDLAMQMQNHRLDIEAIVTGSDDWGSHLYHVDGEGFVSCHNDAGFICIGLGASHANSIFMNNKFGSLWPFVPTVLISYAAKRRAEVAPGVGIGTDMHLITKNGAEPIHSDLMTKLDEIARRERERDQERLGEIINELLDFLKSTAQPTSEQPTRITPPTNNGADSSDGAPDDDGTD